MNNEYNLQNISDKELLRDAYDLLIVAHGFETRATAIARAINGRAKVRLALGFNHNKVGAYIENDIWFRENNFTIIPDLSSGAFSTSLQSALQELWSSVDADIANNPIQIAIDISCFDRQRLAEIISSLRSTLPSLRVLIDFWYCIAAFESPVATVGRNEVAGPVHRRFAGRFTDPGRPLAMIAGLGYELGKVMGAAEYLQASRVIAFFPESPIPAYEPEVTKANKLLLDDLDPRDIIKYPVNDQRRTIATLDSIVRGLQDYNVVLLPGGPKAFSLACMLVQTHHPETSVWRVSSGSSIKARDVKPSNHFVGLRWRIGPN
ncbi:MAG: hypothetical protein PHX38_06400 [Sulfuricella sp.]|nr:hypothetical protein [Sulfuricella sp.]